MNDPKKLSKNELAELYAQVSDQVKFKDLQHELVDHLASGIEAQWKKDKHIPFEEALQDEMLKYPLTGFYAVVEQRLKTNISNWKKKMKAEIIKTGLQTRLYIPIGLFIGAGFLLSYFGPFHLSPYPPKDIIISFTVILALPFSGIEYSLRRTKVAILDVLALQMAKRSVYTWAIAKIILFCYLIPGVIHMCLPNGFKTSFLQFIGYPFIGLGLVILVRIGHFLEVPYKRSTRIFLRKKYQDIFQFPITY